MKVIKLTENQLTKLINEIGAPSFDGGDLPEYRGSEVYTTANVSNEDGDDEFGHMPSSDEFANTQTPQNWYRANASKGTYQG